MFSNVGWGEILFILVLGLILIGPERLPQVVQDARAMIFAARRAIEDAKNTLNNEFGEDFDEFREPLSELSQLRRLNPRTAITRTLFDGDDTYLDMLNGQPAVGGGATAAQPRTTGQSRQAKANAARRAQVQRAQQANTSQYQAPAAAPSPTPAHTEVDTSTSTPAAENPQPQAEGNAAGSSKWDDDDIL
ncbi:Sec-independent protein translocase protein TatB [Corynebacterium sp. TAE3-ERU12]|uniref:Sec-independent protein translocase protein TatB n=1 Tax=Corynebacterium sp. TAE3-ERU12 TaxID=2849491 RepID=UPI001C4790BB|nr:Sec-independent protein translocase protein TatB [Corynebacterium sp. TAE3-ERU12]